LGIEQHTVDEKATNRVNWGPLTTYLVEGAMVLEAFFKKK
jgi:hypothetical protein